MTMDVVEAHKYTSNHKPELEKDSVCGCCCCLEIYYHTEVRKALIYKGRVKTCPVRPTCTSASLIAWLT